MTNSPDRSSAESRDAQPCPFCGVLPLKSRAAETFIIHCGNADCDVTCEINGASPELVISAWNSRTGAPAQSVGMREALIEQCAKIAEPWSGFMTGDKMGAMDSAIVEVREEIAAAIRALASQPSPAAAVETKAGDDIISTARFLIDRLEDLERDIGDGDEEREWAGHVHPAMSRLKSALDAPPHSSAVTSEQWHVRDDPPNMEKIIYSSNGEFVARVYIGPNRDRWANEMVASHNAWLQHASGARGSVIAAAIDLTEKSILSEYYSGRLNGGNRIREGFKNLRAALSAALPQTPSKVVPAPEPARWPAKGDRMKFLGVNGYPFELEAAKKIFTVGNDYEVHDCDVGNWSHSVQFVGVKGRFNGVMFELLSSPLTRPNCGGGA